MGKENPEISPLKFFIMKIKVVKVKLVYAITLHSLQRRVNIHVPLDVNTVHFTLHSTIIMPPEKFNGMFDVRK